MKLTKNIFLKPIGNDAILYMYCFKYGVGYTMRDIRYFWRDGLSSVGMSSEVELPQFRVLGHRQRATEINLTTGTNYKSNCKIVFVKKKKSKYAEKYT